MNNSHSVIIQRNHENHDFAPMQDYGFGSFFFFSFSEKNVVEELVGLGHRSIDPFRISDRLVLIVLLNTNRDGFLWSLWLSRLGRD